MLICFKVFKTSNDSEIDPCFEAATPYPDDKIKTNYIYNDQDCYWWVTELDFPPQVGWIIQTPNDPCELKDYGAPVKVIQVELWCNTNELIAICE